MDPAFSFAHHYLGRILFQESKYQEALAEFLKENKIARGWDAWIDAWLGATYMKLEQRNKTEDILADLLRKSERIYVPPTTLAVLYFALGNNNNGFAWLKRAYDVYDSFLRLIMVEPSLQSARSDPRFLEMAKKLNLKS